MATLGFYIAGFTQDEANEVRAKLNEIAAQLGYTAKGGPTTGEGNAAAMLVAIAKEEVTVAKRTYEIEVPWSGWTQEPIIGARDIVRDLSPPRAVVEQDIGGGRTLAVSLVRLYDGSVEVEDAVVWVRSREGGKQEVGGVDARQIILKGRT